MLIVSIQNREYNKHESIIFERNENRIGMSNYLTQNNIPC